MSIEDARQRVLAEAVLNSLTPSVRSAIADAIRAKDWLAKLSPAPVGEDRCHSSHVTRISDASSFDEICTLCGATDGLGTWGDLAKPCPKATPTPPAATSDGGDALAAAKRYDEDTTVAQWSWDESLALWKDAAKEAERQRDEATALGERLRVDGRGVLSARYAALSKRFDETTHPGAFAPGIIEKLQQEMRALEAALLSEPQASEGRDG